MKVVIYGGSGFIGAWITKLLLNNNFQITIFDKKINKDLLNLIIGKNVRKIDFVEGDILEYQAVLNTAKNSNILINLVGLMTPDCSNNPRLGNQVNIIGSINVFEAALEVKSKLVVYTSSGGVYGQKDKINPFPETHYGAYKLAIEGIARAYYLENKLNSFGLRPFVVFGPGREIGGTASISIACKAVAEDKEYKIEFGGKAGFVYVEDIAEIIMKILEDLPNGARVMNINGITEDVSNIVEFLNTFTTFRKITYNKKNLPIVGEILGNGPEEHLKNFNYTDIKNGLKKTISYYRNF
tara:strand:- start:244 stop:1134 length:891 start_codon:yes stop_codon:yes gene_type:complete